MSDFTSVQPVSGLGNAVRPTPPAPVPPVAEAADNGASNSSNQYQDAKNTQAAAQEVRQAAERRLPGDRVLAGPPPSFEASLLEVEGNLDAIIKRLDAAREKARTDNDNAVEPANQPDAEAKSEAPQEAASERGAAQGNLAPADAEQATTAPANSANPVDVQTPIDQALG